MLLLSWLAAACSRSCIPSHACQRPLSFQQAIYPTPSCCKALMLTMSTARASAPVHSAKLMHSLLAP
jgi:hypothetical protein